MKANLFLPHPELPKANFLISSQSTPCSPAVHPATIHKHLTNIYAKVLLLFILTKSRAEGNRNVTVNKSTLDCKIKNRSLS